MNTFTDLDKSKLSYFHLDDLKAGNFGSTGPPGPVGPVGPVGPAGPIGPAGFNGVDGAEGPQGLQGIQGPVGPQGVAGADGTTAGALITLGSREVGSRGLVADQSFLTGDMFNLQDWVGPVDWDGVTGGVSVSSGGLYQISFTVYVNESVGAGKRFDIVRNYNSAFAYNHRMPCRMSGQAATTYNFTRNIQLRAGDVIHVLSIHAVQVLVGVGLNSFSLTRLDGLSSTVVVNGGFEEPVVTPIIGDINSGFVVSPSLLACGWSGTNGFAIMHNEFNLVPPAPNGLQCAALQEFCTISQELTLEVGSYTVVWNMIGRGLPYGAMPVRVLLDGVEIINVSDTVIPLDDWMTFAAGFSVAVAGAHTLAFETHTLGGDHTTCFDNVIVKRR